MKIPRFSIIHAPLIWLSKVRLESRVECLGNLPALFKAEPIRIEVSVHTIPLKALAVIGRNTLACSAAPMQFQKFFITPDSAAILRRAGSFTANKHNLPRLNFRIFFDGRKPDMTESDFKDNETEL